MCPGPSGAHARPVYKDHPFGGLARVVSRSSRSGEAHDIAADHHFLLDPAHPAFLSLTFSAFSVVRIVRRVFPAVEYMIKKSRIEGNRSKPIRLRPSEVLNLSGRLERDKMMGFRFGFFR